MQQAYSLVFWHMRCRALGLQTVRVSTHFWAKHVRLSRVIPNRGGDEIYDSKYYSNMLNFDPCCALCAQQNTVDQCLNKQKQLVLLCL